MKTIAKLSLYSLIILIPVLLIVKGLDRDVVLTQSAPSSSLPILGKIPNEAFIDQDGNDFSLNQLNGNVWIGDLIFTRCAGPCPLLTRYMRGLQEKNVNKNLRFISFSVDPEYDQPNVLTDYGKKYEADFKSWSFLTGKKETIFKLASQHVRLGVGDVPPEEREAMDQMVWHSTKFVLVDKQMQIRGYYDSDSKLERDKILVDAQSLSNE